MSYYRYANEPSKSKEVNSYGVKSINNTKQKSSEIIPPSYVDKKIEQTTIETRPYQQAKSNTSNQKNFQNFKFSGTSTSYEKGLLNDQEKNIKINYQNRPLEKKGGYLNEDMKRQICQGAIDLNPFIKPAGNATNLKNSSEDPSLEALTKQLQRQGNRNLTPSQVAQAKENVKEAKQLKSFIMEQLRQQLRQMKQNMNKHQQQIKRQLQDRKKDVEQIKVSQKDSANTQLRIFAEIQSLGNKFKSIDWDKIALTMNNQQEEALVRKDRPITENKMLSLEVNSLEQIKGKLLIQLRQTQGLIKSLQNRLQLSEDIVKQLQSERKQRKELQEKCRQLEQERDSKKKVQSPTQSPSLKKISPVALKNVFVSSILYRSGGESFLIQSIQDFTNRSISSSQLLFRKDNYNANIGNYLLRQPYPFVLLMESQAGEVFGLFGEGIQSITSQRLKAQRGLLKFKAFLFNLSRKTLFKNEKYTSVIAVSFSDNILRIGNNQLALKNNYLNSIKVAKVFGETYYSVKNYVYLTGESSEEIQLKNLELHQINFNSL